MKEVDHSKGRYNDMDRLELITKAVESKLQLDSLYDELYNMFGMNPESKYSTIVYSILGNYIDLVAEVIGDRSEWLEWYIWDNECGSKGFEAGVNDNIRSVKTPEDLLWLIDIENNEVD